jgi:hypothetical protein
MPMAKNVAERAVFVLFFYNFSTIPGAAAVDSGDFHTPDWPGGSALRSNPSFPGRDALGAGRRACGPA